MRGFEEIAAGVRVIALTTPTLPPATATNTLVVGRRRLAVIEPATPYAEEQAALAELLAGLTGAGAEVAAILVTHHHRDHTGFAAALRERTGAPIYAHAATAERVDFTVEGVVGGGGACLQNPQTGGCYARTPMFVGQPGVGLHVRLAPVVRLALGLGYRVVAAKAWTGPGSRELGAPVGTVMLEFGWF